MNASSHPSCATTESKSMKCYMRDSANVFLPAQGGDKPNVHLLEMRDIVQWYTTELETRRSRDVTNVKDLSFGWIEHYPLFFSPSFNDLIDFCADGLRGTLECVEI